MAIVLCMQCWSVVVGRGQDISACTPYDRVGRPVYTVVGYFEQGMVESSVVGLLWGWVCVETSSVASWRS